MSMLIVTSTSATLQPAFTINDVVLVEQLSSGMEYLVTAVKLSEDATYFIYTLKSARDRVNMTLTTEEKYLNRSENFDEMR
jgi:hypothetical protein